MFSSVVELFLCTGLNELIYAPIYNQQFLPEGQRFLVGLFSSYRNHRKEAEVFYDSIQLVPVEVVGGEFDRVALLATVLLVTVLLVMT